MKYKIVIICKSGYHLKTFDKLQEEFDNGWEYVDTIQQNGYDFSPVSVLLKKTERLEL